MTTTKKEEDNFTTLVGVKWTSETMIKVHEIMWDSYIKKLLNSKKLRKGDKVKRLSDMYYWFGLIHDMCINKELAFKKK